jgi:DNA-binding response OmpR family regulator
MVIDESSFSLKLTSQALLAFGIKARHQLTSAVEAKAVLAEEILDLIIVGCEMPDLDGYDFVHWLRRSGHEHNAYCPVLMLSGHTRQSKVKKARDCGANIVITRPVSPSTLLERILWMARGQRSFLEAPGYCGPDRRFRPPEPRETDERRWDMKGKYKPPEPAAAAPGDDLQSKETAA